MIAFANSALGVSAGVQRRSQQKCAIRMQESTASSAISNPTRASEPKVTLYSVAVSNYAARVRYLARRKKLSEEHIQIRSPKDLGGLKTEDYLRINPLGKMPAAVIETADGTEKECLFESSVICEYLAEAFVGEKPSFLPASLHGRSRARLIANLLDIYVGPHHQYMYKAGLQNREEGVKNMLSGFDAIEHVMDVDGPYAVGEELSIADSCLWGNWPFYDFMLPTFFGWHPTDGRPKLEAWAKHMQQESPAAKETYAEVFSSLHHWWDSGRWENLSMTPISDRPKMPF